jgi:sulfur-oxidizing protein SoxY
VQTIAVSYAGHPVLAVDGDISLSENPSIHFSVVPEQPGELSVEVEDSEAQTFSETWPVAAETSS